MNEWVQANAKSQFHHRKKTGMDQINITIMTTITKLSVSCLIINYTELY